MVAGGRTNGLSYSYDGITWVHAATTLFDGGRCLGVGWNGSIWVAVGDDDTNSVIATSPDGITWTSSGATPFTTGHINTVAWNGTVWAAGGYDGTPIGMIATSPDGVTWTTQTSGFGVTGGIVNVISWNGTLFLAGGQAPSSTPLIAYSSDGLTWTSVSLVGAFGAAGVVYSSAWNGLQWVAVGINTTSTPVPVIATSPDAITWTARTIPGTITDGQFNTVAWNGSLWMAGGVGAVNGYIATSPDGVTWTDITSNLGGTNPFVACFTVAWNGSRWLVGGRGSGAALPALESVDTITWRSVTTGLSTMVTTLVPRRVQFPPSVKATAVAGPTLSLSYYLSSNTGAATGSSGISVIGFDTADPANSVTGSALHISYDTGTGVLRNTSGGTISVLVSGQVTTDNTKFDLNLIQPCLYVTKNANHIVSSSVINFQGSSFSTIVVLGSTDVITIQYSQSLPNDPLVDIPNVNFLGGQFKTRITFTQIDGGGGGSSTGPTGPMNGVITTSLIPDVGNAYDLGSTGFPFRSLHVTGTTIYLGSASIKEVGGAIMFVDASGNSSQGPTGPTGSNILYGPTGPGTGLGSIGDTYIETNGDVFSKTYVATKSWVEQAGAGNYNWKSIAVSSSGQYLAAVAGDMNVYTNSNYGKGAWTTISSVTSNNIVCIASDSTGQYLLLGEVQGSIYFSNNYGQSGSWQEKGAAGAHPWKSVSCSSDGTKLFAVSASGAGSGVAVSSVNQGVSWSIPTIDPGWQPSFNSVVSSADGTILATVDTGVNNSGGGQLGYIWRSINSGAAWTEDLSGGLRKWASIASSADGTKLAAVDSSGNVYTTTSSGNGSWTTKPVGGAHSLVSISCDSTGDYLAVVDNSDLSGSYIYLSSDFGLTWTPQVTAGSHSWTTIKSSSDGASVVAGGVIATGSTYGMFIYSLGTPVPTWTKQLNIVGPTGPGGVGGGVVTSSLIPDVGNAYDLGSTGFPFRSLHVTGTTIYLGSASIKEVGGAIKFVDASGNATSGGASILYGPTGPASALGNLGDTYIQTNGDVYNKNSNSITFTDQTASGTRFWKSVASSADGQYLAAVANGYYCYTSNDYGVTWASQTIDATHLTSIASDSTGQYLVAVDAHTNNSYICTNNNYGADADWQQYTGAGSRTWTSVTSSADGVKLTAVAADGTIATSTNRGVGWTVYTPTLPIVSLDYDGTNLAIATFGDYVYTRFNYFGTDTWSRLPPGGYSRGQFTYVKMIDGIALIGLTQNVDYPYFTVDGVTWDTLNSVTQALWSSIAYGQTGSNLVIYFCSFFSTIGLLAGGGYTDLPVPVVGGTFLSISCDASGQYVSVADTGLAGNNYGYIYTSDNYGATWPVQSDISGSWSCVAMSSNFNASRGVILATIGGASGGIYISRNYGATFQMVSTSSSVNNFTHATVCGTAGSYGMAAVCSVGYVYTSTDGSGNTWVERTGSGLRNWQSIKSSGDSGSMTLYAAEGNGNVWKSLDDGVTWAIDSPQPSFTSVTSSADGAMLAATDNGSNLYDSSGSIWTSSDSGVSWEPTSSPLLTWSSIASSGDGTTLVATAGTGYSYIWQSTDSGYTWSNTVSAGQGNWTKIACDSTGERIVAINATNGYIYSSSNSGDTWKLESSTGNKVWNCITYSSDGSLVAAGIIGGHIYTGKALAAWNKELNIVGPTGTVSSILYGTEAPGTGVGILGDTYFDTSGNVYHNEVTRTTTWTLPTNLSSRNWSAVASSADGKYLVAGDGQQGGGQYGPICTNSNYGNGLWVRQTSAGEYAWTSIASDASGQHLIAADNTEGSGYVHLSSDYGVSWTSSSGVPPYQNDWSSVTSSANGMILRAVATDGSIWTTTNRGTTWSKYAANYGATCADLSGTDIVMASYSDSIYTKFSGADWSRQEAAGRRNWTAIKITGSTNVVAATNTGVILSSANSGTTWTTATGAGNHPWSSIATQNGAVFVAATDNMLAASGNGGLTFSPIPRPDISGVWVSIAAASPYVSIADSSGGRIYTTATLGASGWDLSSNIQASWTSVAMTSDFNGSGTGYILGAASSYGGLYKSANGNTYTSVTTGSTVSNFSSVAICGLTGNYGAVVAGYNDYIYVSTDGNLATWVDISGIGTPGKGDWLSVQCTGDKSNMNIIATDASGNVWKRFGGATWTIASPSPSWFSITSSADGSILAAADLGANLTNYSGYVWQSFNGGASWIPSVGGGLNSWRSVALSADGSRLAAAVDDEYIYTYTTGTWTQATTAGVHYWSGITSDSTGQYLAAIDGGTMGVVGNIWASTDYGATWTSQTAPGLEHWRSIASSSDGTRLIAGANNNGPIAISLSTTGPTWVDKLSIIGPTGPVSSILYGSSVPAPGLGVKGDTYIETNGDVYNKVITNVGGWVDKSGVINGSFISVATSADGSRLIAADISNGRIFVNSDYGNGSWMQADISGAQTFAAVTSDSTGKNLVGVVGSPFPVAFGKIYMNGNYGYGPWTRVDRFGDRVWMAVTSSSDGSRVTATDASGLIATTLNRGVTWSEYYPTYPFTFADYDGTNILAAMKGDNLYMKYAGSWRPLQGSGVADWAFVRIIPTGGTSLFIAAKRESNYLYECTDGYGGTWSTINSAGNHPWTSVAAAEGGDFIYAVASDGTIVKNNGAGFNRLAGPDISGVWGCISCAATNGTRVAISDISGRGIYISTNGGSTWTPGSYTATTTCVAMADDFNPVLPSGYMFTSASNVQAAGIWRSPDGINFSSRTTSSTVNDWTYVSVCGTIGSYGGAAVGKMDYVYVSTDGGGGTWVQKTSSGMRDWVSVKCVGNSSSMTIIAAEANGYIWQSTDLGDTWTRNTPQPRWTAVTSSADGTKLAAVEDNAGSFGGYIWLSDDSGLTWNPNIASGIRYWKTIASSANGMKLVAGESAGDGAVYTTTDRGVTWTSLILGAGTNAWRSITSSADGTKLSAMYNETILQSTDSGATWTDKTPSGITNGNSIASSSDGVRIVAGFYALYGGYTYFPGHVFTYATPSTTTAWTKQLNIIGPTGAGGGSILYGSGLPASNTGANGDTYIDTSGNFYKKEILPNTTWEVQAASPAITWSSVASSADGKYMAGVTFYNGNVYTNSNYGVGAWTTNAVYGAYSLVSIASDSTGKYLVTVDNDDGYIYTNDNYGAASDWVQQSVPQLDWASVTSSADGMKIVAVAEGGGTNSLWTTLDRGVTWSSYSPNLSVTCFATDGTNDIIGANGDYVYATFLGGRQIGGPPQGIYTAACISPVTTSTNVIVGPAWGQIQYYDGVDGTWAVSTTADGVPHAWSSMAAGPTTNYVYAVSTDNTIAVSTNNGVDFTYKTPPPGASGQWVSVACGQVVSSRVAIADGYNGYIYLSNNSGDVWYVSFACPTARWTCVALSPDYNSSQGLIVATASDISGGIYISSNHGTSYTKVAVSFGTDNFTGVSIAGTTGAYLIAAVAANDYVYTSTDNGATWTQYLNSGNRNWISVKCTDLNTIYATELNGSVWKYTDAGSTWVLYSPTPTWKSVTSSADGTIVTAGADGGGSGGYIWRSYDSGITWAPDFTSPYESWIALASSSDGMSLVASQGTSKIYTYSGGSWTLSITNPIGNSDSVCSDATGRYLGTVDNLGGNVWRSSDYGATWISQTSIGADQWRTITASADGSTLFVTTDASGNYSLSSTKPTWVNQISIGGGGGGGAGATGPTEIGRAHV